MSSPLVAELRKHVQDDLVEGVAEVIVTTNPIYSVVPWTPFTGQAMVVNRENTLGDAGFYAVGATITHKTPSDVAQATFTATKLIGDAEVDDLIQLQSRNAGNGADMVANEIGSKAKTVSRNFQTGMATGDAVGANTNSLHTLCDSGQYTTASAGQNLTLPLVDELLDLVKAKGPDQIDFIMSTSNIRRKYKEIYRTMNGSAPEVVVFNMPDGTTRSVSTYEGIPWFVNDYLSETETANGAALTGGTLTSVWAGCFDDGDRKTGFSAIYPAGAPAGIQVEPVGTMEGRDEKIWRVKLYANWALFNKLALARLTSINT